MTNQSYNQFCPLAMAAEVICTRWTLVVLRELVLGSTRFNELRRGAPRMSPALLSKRLKELEEAGIVARTPVEDEPELFEYTLTRAGNDLRPIIDAVGQWGQRWVETETTLQNLDPNLLMWDMRRNIDTTPMPKKRSVIQVTFRDLSDACRNWWLIVDPGQEVDLCSVDPGHDVDLYVSTALRTMTEVWLGYKTVSKAKDEGAMNVTGNRQLEDKLQQWLGLSPLARTGKLVA